MKIIQLSIATLLLFVSSCVYADCGVTDIFADTIFIQNLSSDATETLAQLDDEEDSNLSTDTF